MITNGNEYFLNMEATLYTVGISKDSKAFMHSEIYKMLNTYTIGDLYNKIDFHILDSVLYYTPHTMHILTDVDSTACTMCKRNLIVYVLFLITDELSLSTVFENTVRQFIEHVVLMEDAKASGFVFENLPSVNKNKFLEYWHLALKRVLNRLTSGLDLHVQNRSD